MRACMIATQSCPTLGTPWTIACQDPLSMGLSWQEYWSGLPFPPPGDPPDPEIQPMSPAAPVLAGGLLNHWATGKPHGTYIQWNITQPQKERNWVTCSDVDGSRGCHTEWSKSEREKQISNSAYRWNLEQWYWWIYLQGRNGDADTENGLADTVGEGETGTNGRRNTDIYTHHV